MGGETKLQRVAFLCDSRKSQIKEYSRPYPKGELWSFKVTQGSCTIPLGRKRVRWISCNKKDSYWAKLISCRPVRKHPTDRQTDFLKKNPVIPRVAKVSRNCACFLLPFPTLMVKVKTEQTLPGKSLAAQSTAFAVTWLLTPRGFSNT